MLDKNYIRLRESNTPTPRLIKLRTLMEVASYYEPHKSCIFKGRHVWEYENMLVEHSCIKSIF